MKSNFFYSVAAPIDLISFLCYKTNELKKKNLESTREHVNSSEAA